LPTSCQRVCQVSLVSTRRREGLAQVSRSTRVRAHARPQVGSVHAVQYLAREDSAYRSFWNHHPHIGMRATLQGRRRCGARTHATILARGHAHAHARMHARTHAHAARATFDEKRVSNRRRLRPLATSRDN
jgi:hypothetical protein